MPIEIDRIWDHLEWLASVPRFAESDRLEECRQYCETELKKSGWAVRRQRFEASDSMLQSRIGFNLVAQR